DAPAGLRLSLSGVHVTLFVRQAGGPKRRYASEAAGFAAVTIAVAALVGLWMGLPVLSNWGSGFATEKPLGAFALAALGLALMHPGKDWRVAFAAGLTVAAIAALGLALVLLNVDLGINRWLAPAGRVAPASFRVASVAFATFMLAGSSLAFGRFEQHHLAAT